MMEKFHISQGQNGQTSKFKVEDFKIFDGIQELSNVIYLQQLIILKILIQLFFVDLI